MNINREKFLLALSRAIKSVPTRTTLPILETVRIRSVTATALEITATDLDMECIITIDTPSLTGLQEVVCVPAGMATALVQTMRDDEIELAEVSGGLQILGKRTSGTLHTLPGDEFPTLIDRAELGSEMTLLAEDLRDALRFCLPAAEPKASKRYQFQSLLFIRDDGKLLIASTNARQFHRQWIEGKGIDSWEESRLPLAAAEALAAMLEGQDGPIGLRATREIIEVSMDGMTFACKQPTQGYKLPPLPNCEDFAIVKIKDPKALAAAMKAVGLSIDKMVPRMDISIADGEMTLSGTNRTGIISSSIEVECDAELPLKYADPAYMLPSSLAGPIMRLGKDLNDPLVFRDEAGTREGMMSSMVPPSQQAKENTNKETASAS